MRRKIKLTQWFVYKWGKPPRQKPHWVILRSPLPRIHNYHNKRLQVKEFHYLMPTYSWILTPIHNWTYAVVTISHFQCTAISTWLTNQCTDPSMWLTTNLRRMLAAKFFSSSTWWRSRSSLVTKPWLQSLNIILERERERPVGTKASYDTRTVNVCQGFVNRELSRRIATSPQLRRWHWALKPSAAEGEACYCHIHSPLQRQQWEGIKKIN